MSGKAKRPPLKIHIPEWLQRLLFTRQLKERPCGHLELIQVAEPASDVCADCVALGDGWPSLRMCMICGYIGCCDTSKNKHALKHHEESGHPLFRSIEHGESWAWCYEDKAILSAKTWRQHAPGHDAS